MSGNGFPQRNRTVRLQVTEVYEEGSEFPLFICSDPTLARENAEATDRIVTDAWWVRCEPLEES
jgi:hypothetical protein